MLGDEVQPFSLDEEFDYDAVTLTPKFTPAEMDAIKELSARKGENSSTDAEGPRDWLTKTASCLFLFCPYSSNVKIKDKPPVAPFVEVYVCVDLSVIWK